MIVGGNHKVSLTDETFPDFSIGSKYLMFLKRNARTDSYRVEKSGVFELKGEAVRSINPAGPHPAQALMLNSDGFVTTVYNRAREVQK